MLLVEYYLIRYRLTELRQFLAAEEESYLQAIKENKERSYVEMISLRSKGLQKDLEMLIQNILN